MLVWNFNCEDKNNFEFVKDDLYLNYYNTATFFFLSCNSVYVYNTMDSKCVYLF